MSYYLELKEESVDELSEAYQFYENEKEGLGEDFLAVLDESFSRIKEHPYHYPVKYKNKRVAVLQKYPYVIIFEVEENIIFVYAVFQTSRNPLIWKERK